MKLTDLNPRWLAEDGRRGQGIAFDCPHCPRGRGYKARVTVFFENPLDGKSPAPDRDAYWHRMGDDFTNITLTPSIDGSDHGHWHGHVTDGETR